ncbi:hypothetical protein HGA91_00625 [candidate division WWE3 bacterium]|nr:hypothetical protein [candidate division WWE3 bacterium]
MDPQEKGTQVDGQQAFAVASSTAFCIVSIALAISALATSTMVFWPIVAFCNLIIGTAVLFATIRFPLYGYAYISLNIATGVAATLQRMLYDLPPTSPYMVMLQVFGTWAFLTLLYCTLMAITHPGFWRMEGTKLIQRQHTILLSFAFASIVIFALTALV